MIPQHLLPNYGGWKEANTGELLRLDQYLGTLLETKGAADEMVIALLSLATPEIREKEGCLIVEELFSGTRFAEMHEAGTPPGEIEYWLNLLGVTLILEELSDAQCEYVARALQKLWTLQLPKDKKDNYACRLLLDEGEWYVTICRNEAFPDSGSVLVKQ